MGEDACQRCTALDARIDALGKILDEREERTKDRFVSVDKITATAFVASEKAIEKADAANQRHFNQINEFRSALEDQTKKYLEKDVYGVQHGALTDKLDRFSSRLIDIEQRMMANTSASLAQTRVTQWIAGAVLALATPSVALIIYFLSRH